MRDKNVICDRKKLYKSGKLLVTAGIFSTVVFGMAVSDVSANDTDNTVLTSNSGFLDKVTDTTSTDKAATPNKVADTTSTDKAATPDKVADTTSTDKAATPDKVADTTSTDKAATPDKVVDTTSTDKAATPDKVADTTSTDKAATPDKVADTTSTDKAATPDKVVDTTSTDKAATPDKVADTTSTDKAATPDKVADTTSTDKAATPDKVADTTSTDKAATPDKVVDTTSTDKAADRNISISGKTVKNIEEIGGKTYFVGDDGKVKKNFTVIVDGQVMYFDKESGALTSNHKQYKEGLSDITNEHNAAYSLENDNFTQIDSYLTANSWYRPKDILKSGTTWTASTDKDSRPLLMSWWPDQQTELSYLKYMQSAGFLAEDVNLSENNSIDDLTAAAMDVQKNVEAKISLSGNTDWLKEDMNQFVDSQSNWNISSESKGTDHLQGGALLYGNSDMTPDANSDYRLLNRTPKNQTGQISATNDQGGYEMLLANDVDNSNPIVQAEQLNWLHYMMNIGSITKNDSTANFDGYRVDAVDNVNADLLQIAGDYFKAAYGTDKSDANANNHISILEDWDNSDPDYVKKHGNEQLTMDFPMHLALKYALNMPIDMRSGLEPAIKTSLVNRSQDATENEAQPNYSFIRAHDSEVQTVIAQIIKDKINPKSDGLTVTPDEIAQAFEIYNADELKADKAYTAFNIPSSYALLLTNKDTVPRVYYGDLFTDDGQYMSDHSPYYDAITTLLASRIKYAAGGQSMGMTYLHDNQEVLTSVRYGKGALTADDLGNADTRTQGIGLVISNKTDLSLKSDESVVLNMGAAHKNQAYRPAMLTTKSGLKIYDTDDGAPIVYTNNLGQLIFNADTVYGVSDPQVSGYLAAWVPVGATEDQDARTKGSHDETTDGNVYHSNAALDSQVIYEGFSNFQAMPTTTDEYTNVKIAQNAQWFKKLGLTSFELAPQYRSSTDSSFLDSVIQNGYAFTDRYDVGYNTPTKYGTVDQLLDALRALHSQDIQAINDWVPDQIYNLPGEQIVTASRTNGSGKYDDDSVISNTLYDSRTIGGGEYQAMYGGAFLDQLKQAYPGLFETKQLSTGVAMDPDVKIKEWSAKYFNGSNIQGRGAWYVLKDWATNKYFSVSSNNTFLPKQLLGEKASTGFITNDGKTEFYSTSGYQAKNTFIEDNGNWYYFDNDGYSVVGKQVIDNKHYYFLPNGVELQDAYLSDGDKQYYYKKTGRQIVNQYYRDEQGDWRYFFADGHMALGLTDIVSNDGTHATQYFDNNGVQVKGTSERDKDGNIHYFDGTSGNLVVSSWGQLSDGSWLYLNDKGIAVTGAQQIDGQSLYFNEDGKEVKGDAVTDNQGNIRYFDGESGHMVVNSWGKLPDGSWMYLNDKGIAVTGQQKINNEVLYFNADGKQIKSAFKELVDGSWLYLNDKGIAVTGAQQIDGQSLYFNEDGKEVKGDAVTDNQGNIRYFDGESGHMVVNSWGKLPDGSWMYLNDKGIAVTGQQKINNEILYFDADGKQLKNTLKTLSDGSRIYLDGKGVSATGVQKINGKVSYFDVNGKQVSNHIQELPDGSWMYLDNDGLALIGNQDVDGKQLYFDVDGKQIKNDKVKNSDGTINYYTGTVGEKLKHDFGQLSDGSWMYLDENGNAVTGEQNINGQHLYFKDDGQQVKGDVFEDDLGRMRYYSADSGEMVVNQFEQISDGAWAYFGDDGVAVTGEQYINGQDLFFDATGQQVKGESRTINGIPYTFEKESGEKRSVNIAPLLAMGNYVTNNGTDWQYEVQGNPVKGLYSTSDNKLRYFDLTTGVQIKGNFVTIGHNTYYFNPANGDGELLPDVSDGHYGTIQVKDANANEKTVWVYRNQSNTILKGIQNIHGNIQYFDLSTGEQIKGGIANYDGNDYYFESAKGNLTSKIKQAYTDGQYVTKDGKSIYEDAQQQSVSGLVAINGQLQYFNPKDGVQVKNQQIIVDGVTYYFDENGNGQYLFTNTTVMPMDDFTKHNTVYSDNDNNFKNNVDGFLTADTWYRPKEILKAGTTWTTTSESDMRPLITTWWPNKNVQVNYLNFMKQKNLLHTNVEYSLLSDQYDLNIAAQAVQTAIEKRIAQENSTEWLQNLLFTAQDDQPSFVKQQFIWNKDSEYQGKGDAWFQGGYLKYGNNKLTPNTNSNYRKTDNAFEFLLANDIDNSNPVVQAENLNWLEYLMNFGTITGKDDDANFDSIRVDAVDFISNDTIQRTYDYLRDAYQVDQSEAKANQHISLVEAGLDAGTSTVKNDALIESNLREAATLSLANASGKNSALTNMLQDVDGGTLIADHTHNSTENEATPNYSIIHAHDKGIQEKVGAAISDATGADWTNFTDTQLKSGLDLYYKDQRATDKKYNIYNLPSIYALMLTNKDTVPRVYYGDMYQDNGQYMAEKSIYYNALESLMSARKSYVSGGQTMDVDSHGLLKSVRFGKGAMTADTVGNEETRTEGIGVLVGNDASLKLNDSDTVTLDMGAAHKNQKYRAAILTTNNGLSTFDSDKDTPIAWTNDNGILTFSNKNVSGQDNTNVHGVANPQVSGYLAVWVPFGAKDDQNAGTSASTVVNTDGKVLHSNASLDSNLIFEGFSNFQPRATTNDELTNVVIAKNADLFQKWGITSFEMAPQYRSSQDHTFLDSTIDNGYAFTDRYDLGFNTPTKYGTDSDLRLAIKSLHKAGMQVMADVVDNQVYNLPDQEVVSASRAGVYGNDVATGFDTQLYAVNSVGGGKYQAQYGGQYLSELKNKYPDLFEAKAYDYWTKNYANDGSNPYYTLSQQTRDDIPSDEKIEQWSAKYMNGTNVLGHGMGYVLKDWNTGQYFKINKDGDSNLPV
ncbi:glycoside hydrolase family 70 protein [Leuconostoc carnosum]|uniref:glycoside hydrolase family 70 protein n=1 Tax=Leuconostoc carnosum TaxID=1252 RepID=UPI00345DCDCA